ncbi:Transcription regulator LuxR, C-terminal [Penicillium camemberti]|uniref:Transcription regulator LuxR, C-terminal n=1 Tax=Penicillium camemberti (strain FM 013) TaxID=1429867 RepID=A0A0G4PFV3_PENC3|nr:Transcription regulator LuxR, C-terminal [Penicillium camemberti]
MFKALMGGGRSSSSSDVRSSSKSSRRKSEKPDKSDTRSISSRKSSRGDDRDRGLGDLSSYSPSASRSKRGPPSIAGESIASTYVTAEPEAIDDSDRYYIERTPKRRDSERESKSSRRRDQDRSDSPEREKRRSRRGTQDTLDDDLDRERDRRERRRTQSGDPYVPPISTSMPPSAPGAQFAAEIGAPGFSQFPMQYDAAIPSTDHSPAHEVPYDPHVQQQFPGQFPEQVAAPYRPPNPAGAAADYYGDQGQSVEHQPGIRPAPPSVLPNTQAHLMAASPSANPPPEPSSLGETGAAAAYFDDDFHAPAQEGQPPAVSLSRPPKPSKPSKPSSSGVLPAAAVGAAAYGIGGMMSHSESHSPPQHTTSHAQQGQPVVQAPPMTYNQPVEYDQPMASSSYQPPSKPSHSHSFSEGAGIAAAGAATGYMLGHHHHSSSPEHAPQYAFQHHEQYSQAGGMQGMQAYAPGHNNALYAAGAGGYAVQSAYNPGFYPHGPSALAFQERQRGPMGRFVDFWRDPEAVGRFEDYTESIGVCKYCFQPGTSSVDAPRKHHYHRRRRNSPDRRSSGSSRISKVSRYNSSEDEGRRRPKSKKSSSWLPGMLAGYATKSLFSSKEFDDSYSLRSGRVASSHGEEDDRRSHTSRGVTRRSGRSPQREHYADSKHASQSGYSRHTRSRSRSSSRSGRHSYLKEAALGAAVGGAALAVAKSRNRSRSRSRSPERRQRRKDSSSSSSFVNLPRPAKKSIAGGIGSFFTASSENRKKRHTKKRSGFFSFKSGSSSSSLDNDLAFGDGFSKKSSKSKKKGKKGRDVDAALVELSDTATRLAGSSPHGPGRSAGQMYKPRSRQSNYAHSTTQDEEWVDAESEDQSSSSVSSALAFGGSSVDSSSDSASSKWGWRWGSKKDKKRKDKRSSATNAALVAGAGAIGAAAISSVRHRDSDPPSRSGSLQQVYPMPTSDPSRFDVAKMSPSVSGGEPTLIRPGPIPLQQPQPFTPVSQSVYTTQGAVSGPIPVYSTPAVPPLFANEVGHYDSQSQITRDAAWAPEASTSADRRKPRRSDSSPVFPTQETASSLKRRFTAKEQASVQFNLTEEQAERERHLIRREKNYRDEVTDQPVQLIDREEELARQETERRERRRKERDGEERRYAGDREKDSSSWVGAAAAGAVGAAAVSTILSRKTDDDEASEASQRYNERREKRRAERKRDTDTIADSSIVSRFEPTQPIDEEVTTVEHREDQKKESPRSPRPAQVYDDYAEFYAPEELRHSPDVHARSSGSPNMPTIVEVEPASERRTQEEPEPTEVDYSYEPYQHVDRLPWPVPGLNLIEPTPPHSVTGGSVRDVTSPTPPVNKSYDTQPRERPTGSRVSWGEHETHEYEIPSSSEQDPLEHDISPIEISPKDVPLPASEISQSKDMPSTSEYGDDIEFAATIAAATAAAGFDPSLITDDPSYHTRTSPPGSEDEHTFTSPWSASARKEPHGFVEGEIEEIDPKFTKDMTSAPEHVVQDKDELFFDEPESFSRDRDISSGRRDKASIAQEVIEQLNGKYGKRDRTASPEKDVDVFSMPGGFDTAESRDLPDARSVVSAPAPVAMDPETPTKSKSKKSRRSGDVFDLPEFQERELAESPDLKDETSKSRKSRRSGDDFEIYESREVSPTRDESYSVISAPVSKDETSKSKSRKSRRSGDDFGIAEYPESVVPESRDDSFSVISAPVSKDETSKSKSRKSRRSGDDFEIYESREPSESRDDTRSITSTPAGKEEYESSKSGKSRRSGDDYNIPRSREISESYDDNRSVFSAPVSKDETSKSRRSRRSGDDFDISRSRDVSESRDESRSVVSESAKSRKSRRSGDDFDPRRDAEAASDDAEGGEEKKRRRKRRSKHGSDTFSVDDDARSAITDIGDDKSERRKHRHRSSREAEFDDNASITSSPARIDESREKRRGKDEKEKSGGFLRSIFGSQVSAPAERVRSDHSRSSSLDKRSSREAISEAGVDDERRRHKKRSSKHRSSSNGDELDRYMSDKEKGAQDDTNLEEYRSSRQQKEERRRHRYEEIVDSGRKRESEKDGYSDNFDDQSFLRKHPEILAPEREDYGASWLPAAAGSAAVFAAASGLNEIPQQRPRSQSTSPPATEKTLDLTPKSLSRPASPETSHPQGSRSPKQRRHSVAKSTNESPTAVPLHFRRPPTSPGLSRAVPVEQPAPIASPGSPSQQRNRRPGSVEFRNSREIRPLWLVERHSLTKGEPEAEEPLPSLPSSKTSSRAPSMDNLKSLHDDDGLKSWEHVDLSQSIMENQRPSGLAISTEQANESHDRDLDLLGSQQPTPTAEHFQDSESKKEKRRYEFHSPSELLQDPAVLDELPPSPTLDALPSAEGSMVGVGSREQETQRALDALEGVSRPQNEPETPTQEHDSFFGGVADFAKGAAFAGVVDAAAIAAVREHDQSRSLPSDEPTKAHGLSDIVDEAVAADSSPHDHDKALVDEEAPSEPVTAIEENYPTEPEPVRQEIETPKEFVPESTEQPVESSDLQLQPETEVVPDEGAATQSSKKKNKKKKGKKNQAQDADLGTPAEPLAQEDLSKELAQDPAVEVPEVEPVSAEPEVAVPEQSEHEHVEASRKLEPEIVFDEPVVEAAPVESAPIESAPVEPEVAVPEQPEAEPIEAPRELEIEPEVAATQEPEVVTALETEPTEVVPTETEQAEDTASSTKKAKRDKKKQKKKSKNASTSEEPADDTVAAQPEEDISASKEVEGQQEDTAPAPVEEIVAAPLPEDIATSTEPLENTSDQITVPSAATDEEQAQSQQQSGELAEPVEQVSTEESGLPVSEDASLAVEEQETPEPTFTDANETPITGATQPEAEEAPRSLEEIEKPTEDSTPEAPLNDTTPEITETPKEDTEGEDNFQEAVEEQVSQPAEEKEPAPEPPIEVAADAAAEGSETKAEKRKNKKKKNRKSAAVEETQSSAETPAPETESPEIQDPEPEQSAVVEPVDTQSPPIGGEALPTDLEHLEQPTQDVEQPLQTTIEEPAATQEQGQVPLEAAVDATPVVIEPVDPAGPSDELSQPAVIDVQPNAELPDPAEEASREISEPSAVETQPEAEVQAEPQLEVEAEPEVALTAAQKKKAKKNKKKGKQSESSVPEDEKPAESISPAPEIETAAEDMAKEAPLVTEDVSVDTPTQEREMELPVEVEQKLEPEQTSEAVPPQEEASPEPLPEPTTEVIEPEAPKEEPTVSEEQPKVEESPAEPEVPMTAAERKKAKKAKKKQQKEQEESTSSVAEDIKPVEAEPAPEAESAEQSKGIAPAAEIDDVAPTDLSAPVSSDPAEAAQEVVPALTTEPDAALVTEDTPLPTETETLEQTKDTEPSVEAEPPVEDAAPSSEIEATEVIPDVPLALEEATAPADAPQDLDQQDDIVKVEEPKSEEVAPAPTEEPSVDAETDAPKAEEQSPEPEVPMTAAERKKAKKNKKKQQKQESVQLDEQPKPEAEPTSTEEKSVKQVADILPESEATPTAEAAAGVDEPTEPEAARDLETETKPEEEQAQDVPVLDSELAPDAPAGEAIPAPEIAEQAIDVQDVDKETAQDPTVEVTSTEEPKEEKLDTAVSDEPVLDKSLDDKPTEPTPDPAVEETQPTESTESPVVEQAEDEQAATSSKSKKKNKKKKRQSVAPEEEQPAPAEEESKVIPAEEEAQPAPAEEEIKLTPAEEEPAPVPAEVESADPTPSEELEQPPLDKDVEVPIVTEEAPKAEESTQPDTPTDVAAAEAAEEASMTPAQKRKAKKDKKKRQLVAAEQDQSTPTEEESKAVPAEEEVKLTPAEEEPAPVPAEVESTEPALSQEPEQLAPEQSPEPPIVAEEAPEAEETAQQESSADAAAMEAAEEASMSPAQKRKAKKDKKKRQSVAAEQEQPTPTEEEPKAVPAVEEAKIAPAEEQPTPMPTEGESTESPPSQELEQGSLTQEAETPIVTEEEPKAEEPSPEETTQVDVSADTAAIEAAEEASMTPAQKRKAKKDKKKRQSVVAEEEQPVPVEESKPEPAKEDVTPAPAEEEHMPESAREEPTEPILTQEAEQSTVSEDAQTPIMAEEEVPKAEEPSLEEATQQDAPADAAATEAAEEEAMTPAQKKKAKKDKKKQRKSVAFDDNATPSEEPKPEQDLSAPEDKVESQDAPAELVIPEESTKELPVTEEVAEPATEGEVAEKIEEPASSEQSKEIAGDEPISAAASDAAIPTEVEDPKSAVELPEQPEQDPQTLSEPQSPSAQEPEVPLTAAQKKKAKKNKKKGKSVDLAENAPAASDAAQESERIVETSPDTPTENLELQDTPASEPAQPAEGLEQENTTEPEPPKAEELETTETAPDDVPKEESPDVKETDEAPATEAIVDAQPTPSQEAEAIASSPAETTEEAGMSAKERRKAAKKAKKRQSKNVDADNDAATSSEAANSVEKVLTSTDTDAPGLSAVPASSPAEHDGKEHQSHDIETYDATAQNTASTDKYMSSQVEQTPIESPFLDYPPQPVLERSVDSGELAEGNDVQEGDVAPTAHEREGELVEPTPLEEMKTVDDGEIIEEKLSVPEADYFSMEKDVVENKDVEETPVDVPIDVDPEAQTQESLVEEEEASETAVSKKQKKKNKKKNKKQEEEAAAPEPETSTAEDKEQPEAAPLVEAEPLPVLEEQSLDPSQDIEETTAVQTTEDIDDTKEISVPEAEAELVPVPEEQPTEHPQDIEEIVAVQTTEGIADTKEINAPEGETVAPPTEETTQSEALTDAAAIEAAEEATMTPAQKRKAKKDKKKQRQSIIPQEPEAELQPEEQTTPEPAETSVQDVDIATESAPAEIITQDEAVTSADEPTVQPIDVTEEAVKDLVTPSEDTEQHVRSQEIEGGERSLELPSTGSNVEEGDRPAGEAPAEILDDEQASDQVPPEAAPEPEGESASVPKKMSKKEKKKAAAAAAAATAAAAAALLEEEKLVESQPEPEEPPTITPQALEEVVEHSMVQEPQASGTEDKPQPDTERSPDETTELTTSEPKEDAPEPPVEVLDSTEPLESEMKPEESTKDLAEEPAAIDTITRKASKKDKKKAKKQAKQEVIEPASFEEEVPTTEPATVEAVPEPEPTFEETPTEIVPEPESVAWEEIQEAPNPELESIETPALDDFGIVSEDKQPSESEKNEAVVSLDTLHMSSPAEPTDQATNYEPLGIQDPAEKNAQEDEAQFRADARDLEKTADLEVIEGSVEDGPGEPEVMPALSKKMSKKDKRKAKKNDGINEEVSTQQQEEPQAEVAELPTESETRPTEPAVEQETLEIEDAAEPQPTLERELPVESSLTIEDQPISAPEVQVEPTQPDEVPVSEEIPLSRKASKKKAKKAQKANKSLDTEQAENAIDADQHAAIVPFEEQSKAQNPEIPDEKSSHDEEDWPAIDWQAKFEESQRLKEVNSDPEPEIPAPEPEIISEFVDSSFPVVSQDANEAAEEDSWALLSKKDKKKAKKNKKQSPQASPEVEEPSLEPSNEKEIEPPARTTTPGGSKIANLFPGLERAGFRRSALDQQTPSLKDSAEEETTADLEANRDLAIPVSEAPLATTETKEIADDFTSGLPSSLERQIESTISELNAHSETPTATEDDSIREPELPMHGEKSLGAPLSLSTESSNERTRTEEPSSPTRLPPPEEAGAELCELRRSPSIHGRHQHPPRTWSLDEPSLPALAPSPPRSLFGPTDDYVRPRTPLEPIAEQEPHGRGTMARRGTPRLEMKPEHVLPRPQTPVRKFTDNAFDREAWPTENQKGEDFNEIQKTPEQGILKPSTSSGKLRRTNRSISGDLRAASRALDSQPSNLDLDQLPSSSSYDPVTDKGKRPLRNMSDVYEGWGETPNSPRSPSRPPSVRRRRSMQHLQDIETRLDQLISENRLLIAARDEAEDKLRNTSVARRKSDRALNTRDGDLRDRESEVEQLKNSVEWLQKEMTRLTQENEGLTASNSALATAHAAEVNTVRESSTRELVELQAQHSQLSSQMEDRVRQEIESALAQKDIELRRLRTELEEARDKVKELQQQIAASVHDNALVFRDEEYFEAACQKLCGHVQSWVVRFSKHSDKRRCRPLSELQDEKIADRFDNALLDGSDPDAYLSDRVRRRDVFMSVVMTMVWEYIFTRYLFGMDREQRQKLKSLEKQLGEVGPTRAVHRWRATTLTLLSRRPAFAAQRESDTEAVTLEIFQTLSRVLPPPSHVESQLLDNLRKIMRVAVSLSLEMRTQLAEFIMLPPLQPEYDTNGDLARQVYFNAALMNERSGLTNDNGELEAQQSIVRIVLFPLVVKKGNDVGEGEDEDVVCPAQVLIARPSKDKKVSRMMSGDRMSIDATRSVHSIAQSIAHSVAPSSMMDMSNVI